MPDTDTPTKPDTSTRADRLPTSAKETAEQRSPLKQPQRGDIIELTDLSHPDLTNHDPRKIVYTVQTIDASDFVHARTHDGSDYIIPLSQWPAFAQDANVVYTHSEQRPLIAPGLDRQACAEERERERVGQGRHAPVPDPVTGLSPRNEPASKDDPAAQAVPGVSGSHRDPQPIAPRDAEPPASGQPDKVEPYTPGTPGPIPPPSDLPPGTQPPPPKQPDSVEPAAHATPGSVGKDSPAGQAQQAQAKADKEERERREGKSDKGGTSGTSAKQDDTRTAEHSKSPGKDDKDDKSSKRG